MRSAYELRIYENGRLLVRNRGLSFLRQRETGEYGRINLLQRFPVCRLRRRAFVRNAVSSTPGAGKGERLRLDVHERREEGKEVPAMPLFQIRSLSPAAALADAAADYRTARRVEQYRLSARAIYFPAFPGTRYVPFAAVTRAVAKSSSMPVKGCCGKELPVVRVRLFYDGEFYQDFLLEKAASASRVLSAVRALRPEAEIVEEMGRRSAV